MIQGEMTRLRLLSQFFFSEADEAISRNVGRFNERKLVERIAGENEGMIGLKLYSRDCDMCEGRWGEVIPASELSARIDRLYETAEGPVSYLICAPHEAESYESSSRDLALEAFEDGHAHVVFC